MRCREIAMSFASPLSSRLLIACALLLAGACVSSRPPANVACKNSEMFRLPVSTTPVAEMLLSEDVAMAVVEGTAEAAILGAMDDNSPVADYFPRNIAVLSGGGEFGAYGAGFFQSYLERKPVRFNVVTGVSTGALQATGVFLGDAEDLEALVEGYAIDRETDLATQRPSIAGLPLTTSIYSLDPARERFGRFLTSERIARVADAAREGRKLLVGVVEVQDGQFYAFDLTAIASSALPTAEKRACYTEAVFASAAVPVVFPPVLLDNRQYFDGGVRASVFLDRTIVALEQMKPEYAAEATIYVLFNGYLDTPPQDDLAVSITDAVARTRTVAFDQIDRASLQAVADLADRFNVAWARIEPGLCRAERQRAPNEEIFNAPFMACLIREGRREGAEPAPFNKIK